MSARFRLSEPRIEEIRQALKTRDRMEATFKVGVRDESGRVIAEIEKLLHIRKKERPF